MSVPVTPSNIKYAERFRGEILNAIQRETFDYAKTFPDSKRAKLTVSKRKKPTVSEVVQEYIDNGKKTGSLSPSSIAGHQRWFNSRIKEYWSDKIADDTTPGDMRAWIVGLIEELAPKSVRNVVGLAGAALAIAAMDEKIARNPLEKIKLKAMLPKRRKKDEEKLDPFNLLEISAILSACDSTEEKSLWQFAFSTGLRTGELIAFKWKQIDWLNGKIHIEDNVVSAEKGTVEKDLKTARSERDIPMLPGTVEALTAMRPISELRSEYVFTHPKDKGRWRDEKQMRDRWKITLRRAKVRYRNPYQTRHTFASTLLEQGEQELVVALLLGHTTVEMVRRTYGRYIKQPDGVKLKGDYSKFGAGLGQQSPPKDALKQK